MCPLLLELLSLRLLAGKKALFNFVVIIIITFIMYKLLFLIFFEKIYVEVELLVQFSSSIILCEGKYDISQIPFIFIVILLQAKLYF